MGKKQNVKWHSSGNFIKRVSLKVKYKPIIWSSHSLQGIFPLEIQALAIQRLIHKCSEQLYLYSQKLETSKYLSTNEWVNIF